MSRASHAGMSGCGSMRLGLADGWPDESHDERLEPSRTVLRGDDRERACGSNRRLGASFLNEGVQPPEDVDGHGLEHPSSEPGVVIAQAAQALRGNLKKPAL